LGGGEGDTLIGPSQTNLATLGIPQ